MTFILAHQSGTLTYRCQDPKNGEWYWSPWRSRASELEILEASRLFLSLTLDLGVGESLHLHRVS